MGRRGRRAVTEGAEPREFSGWRIEGRPDRMALRAAVEHVHARRLGPDSPPLSWPAPVMRSFLIDTEPAARAVLWRESSDGEGWNPVFVSVRTAEITFFGFSVHDIVEGELLAGELSAAYNALIARRIPRPVLSSGLALDGTRSESLRRSRA